MSDEARRLELMLDVPLTLTAELGRCTLRLSEVLALGAGSLVALDRAAGAPVDLLVNNRLIAHGEVVAIDDRFGVRITDIVARRERA